MIPSLRSRAAAVALALVALFSALVPGGVLAQQYPANWAVEDPHLKAYFEGEVRRLEAACLADVRTAADWSKQREERRRQLFDMLGLWPLPARTELKPVVTGRIESEGFTVEKLHFQSLPGLYVTANLYLPTGVAGPAPAILYVCGHAEVKANGVSHGNKTGYQHHGAWLARNGYACLVIDTLQLGEIQGDHHGTYRLGQWWWNSRGYTPAGVEAWNSIRAIDYLETRPEVDKERIGMTGRSGGGSYTWTTAALDERIRVAAPVAGITDLRNHVCDGSVEGHCDCMFFVNSHRWDFALNAALIAPRPLLVVNTDADNIFPLDGVHRLFEKTRRIYALQNAYDRIGLVIGPGPHNDSQNLQVPVLRWFNQHLRGSDPLVTNAAVKPFPTASLRVFDGLPADQRNTTAQEFFGPAPSTDAASPETLRESLLRQAFGGWPLRALPVSPRESGTATAAGSRLQVLEFESQPDVPLHLMVLSRPDGEITRVELRVMAHEDWVPWLASARVRHGEAVSRFGGTGSASDKALEQPAPGSAIVWFWPRGTGPSAWPGDARKQTQIRRRFQLLGQTVDGMRVWDVRRAIAAARGLGASGANTPLNIQASGTMAAHALHAALFEDRRLTLTLDRVPESYREGPDYLNVARVTRLPQVREFVGRKHELRPAE